MAEAPEHGRPGGWAGPVLLGAAAVLIPAAAVRLPVALDEAYYWSWSGDLAWSYYDHPPAIAVAIAAARSVLGEGQLALRALSLSCMAVTAVAIWATARLGLRGHQRRDAGWLAVLAVLGALMFMVGYLPATPDPLQGAALAVAGYLVAKALRDDARPGWGAGAGFVLTAGILVKHSSALVAVGALLGALWTPLGRRALGRPGPWVGVALGVAALAPWVSADLASADGATAFQALRVFEGRPARGLLGLPLVIGGLALTGGPAFTVALGSTIWGAARRRIGAFETVGAFGAAALLLGCVAAAGLGAGELNWLMPAFVFGAPAAIQRTIAGGPRAIRGFAWVSAATALLPLVVLLHIVYPFAPIPATKDRTARAIGYEDVARVVEQTMRTHDASVVVTRRYQLASELRFHLSDSTPVLELGSGRRSQYDRWARPRLCPGDVAILALGRRDLPPELRAVPLADVVTATRARGGRAHFPVFVTPIRIQDSPYCPAESP